MSKRQEKIARLKAEQQEFLIERKKMQYLIFKQAQDTGIRIYEQNKEKIPAEEVEKLEAQMKENTELLEKIKAEILEVDPQFEA